MNDVTRAHQAYYEARWWRDETFLDDLDRHARERPGKTAVVGHNLATGRTDTIDYAQLSRLTDQMARGLVNLGVHPGECVGVLLPDIWEMLPLVLACIKAGVRIVPVPPEFGRAEMEFALRLTDARLLIAGTETFGGRSADMALALSRDIGLPERIVAFGEDRPPGTLSFAEQFLTGHGRQQGELAGRRLGPDEPFVVLFTSGTTGTTKAPVHSQNTLYAEIRGYAGALGFDQTLVNTTAHSNMYRAGLVTRLLTSLVLGGTAVCLDTWDPAASLELIRVSHSAKAEVEPDAGWFRICWSSARSAWMSARYSGSAPGSNSASAAMPWDCHQACHSAGDSTSWGRSPRPLSSSRARVRQASYRTGGAISASRPEVPASRKSSDMCVVRRRRRTIFIVATSAWRTVASSTRVPRASLLRWLRPFRARSASPADSHAAATDTHNGGIRSCAVHVGVRSGV
jgi:acyl-CoA synthetase (AMP-forming)/AMP-acid ligase II